jgi:hypothetical protein
MPEAGESDRLKRLLGEARQKHATARLEVSSLKTRVGPTSFKLVDAKKNRFHCRTEVVRLVSLLKKHGLSDKEITNIRASEPEVIAVD